MIVSSPTSAALQSGTHCSPSPRQSCPARPHHETSLSHISHGISRLSSSTPAVPPRAAASAAGHRVSARLRLSQGIEEIRSALKRHTVDTPTQNPPPGPSGDQPRGPMSAGVNTLGGGKHPPDAASAALGSSQMPSASAGAKRSTPDDAAIASSASQVQQPAAELEGSHPKRPRQDKPAVKQLPRQYELADPRDIVVLISSMLLELIRFNDKIPLNEGRLTRFHSRSPPRISVHDYLQRLTTHATLSPPILLSMVYYIDRLCALYPAFTVSSLTIHRFLIASATVASKGLSDSFWTNKTYARVGGISVAELALLELEFLWRVEWRIVPQPEVLVDYYRSLVERCDGYEIESGEGEE
ncbi:Pho80p cyclin [Paecilomyces lecythidis]|uniref:Pho80p cyclin n=1 Tax=Paecilomyces lecythidis TaxID=3004212 RepID=A0ABR3X7R5_9EURO